VKLISWNVNGLRSITRKGFLSWLSMESPDILCLQETKAHPNQLTSELTEPDGYTADYAAAQKKGYSGVSIWTRSQNIAHTFTPSNSQQTSPRIISPPTSGVKINRFDEEGRVLTCDYENFTLVNSYFPNSQRSLDRLSYKLDFYECMLGYCNRLRRNGKRVIICGDFNTAHHEIDLARPKENRGNSGFLPEEREHLNRFTEEGYVDVFRYFHPEGNHYTWWSYQFNARANNIGWRIDYFLVSEDLLASLEDCYHLTDTYGSDHCPVVMKIASAR